MKIFRGGKSKRQNAEENQPLGEQGDYPDPYQQQQQQQGPPQLKKPPQTSTTTTSTRKVGGKTIVTTTTTTRASTAPQSSSRKQEQAGGATHANKQHRASARNVQQTQAPPAQHHHAKPAPQQQHRTSARNVHASAPSPQQQQHRHHHQQQQHRAKPHTPSISKQEAPAAMSASLLAGRKDAPVVESRPPPAAAAPAVSTHPPPPLQAEEDRAPSNEALEDVKAVAGEFNMDERAVQTRNLVKRFVSDIWNRGELDMIPEVCAKNLRFNGSVGMDRVGHDGFRKMVVTIRESLADYHCEIHSMVVEGNKAFCRLRFTGKHTGNLLGYPPTGRLVSWMGATEFTCKGNLIVKVWELGDVKSLEEQLKGPTNINV